MTGGTLDSINTPRGSRSREAFETFRNRRYFPALDGLRAISILLVISWHAGDAVWHPLKGMLGVTLFFVLSGFLITTLLLREEDRSGRVSLRGFYTRRAFRILPLYFLALAAYSAAVAAGVSTGAQHYSHRLIYFFTFTNEFAGEGAFNVSWSLGVEEKFYIFWPLLAFAWTMGVRQRGLLAGGLLGLSIVSLLLTPRAYPAIYTPILAGCALAIALHERDAFTRLFTLTRGPIVACFLAALVACELLVEPSNIGYQHVPFALISVGLFPAMVMTTGWLHNALSWRPLVHIGTRAYALYLFHQFVINLVNRVVHRSHSVPIAILRLVLIVAGSLIVAEVLHRLIEAPMIRRGHRASKVNKPLHGLASDPVPGA